MNALPSRLLLLLDSRSPAGAHSHSGGMEAAVHSGYINTVADVADFCHGRLNTAGRVAAGFAAAACRGWSADWNPETWAKLDAEFSARTPSEVTRSVSRALGSGLRRLLHATVPEQSDPIRQKWQSCPEPAPHHSLVLGAGICMAGGTARIAARAAALATCTAPASAAVRLLGLDPYAIHRVTSQLSEEIDRIADECCAPTAMSDLPADSAPALDLLADLHATLEVRLFAS
jgi:urease accessory protein